MKKQPRQRCLAFPLILSTAMVLVAMTLPLKALAENHTTTYTSSYKYITDTTNIPVSQQVDTFAVELIGRMQGSSTVLYDQTFNVAFNDSLVQAAIGTLKGTLTGDGATSFLGPSLLSTNTSLINSRVTSNSVFLDFNQSTDFSVITNLYIGPQTIMTGDKQSQPFDIPAGSQDFDTLSTFLFHQVITTTTINTFLTTEVYEVEGVEAVTTAPVPEPTTMLLFGAGIAGLVAVGRKK